MITFFPYFYPDELLYSVLARYHTRSGNSSYKITLIELFGVDSIAPVADLTSNLSKLSDRINNQRSAVLLRDHYTLWPYYRPFLTHEVGNAIDDQLLNNKGSSIHIKSGVIASSVPLPRYLKYCSNCYLADIKKHGEAYWHRSHQLPGVYMCPIHCINLQNSEVYYKSQEIKQKFYDLNRIEINIMDGSDVTENDGKLSIISNKTSSLLTMNYPTLGLDNIRLLYLTKLKEKGFLSPNSRIRFKDLLHSFNNFWGEELLNMLNSPVKGDATWLHKMLRKPRTSCHPLRHILFMIYLGLDISEYKKVDTTIPAAPFGLPAFPCLNRAATHYRENIISEVNIAYCDKTGNPVGTFRCNCGFEYSRRGPDSNIYDKYRRTRILKFGNVFLNKVKKLHEEGLSEYQIGKMLDVDYNSIMRQIQQQRVIKKLNTVVDNKSELRKTLPSVYIWLYRHDNNWLYRNLPSKLKNNSNNSYRVDWEKRDQELSQLILNEVKKIKDTIPLVRITKGRIGRGIARLSFIEKHLSVLPLSKNVLEKLIESTDQYKIRRIKYYANELRKQELEVKEWKLKRKANIKYLDSDVVRNAFYLEVDNNLKLIERDRAKM